MKLIPNKTANGAINTLTSQCGRYAWHCQQPVAKAKGIKSTMNNMAFPTK